MKSFFKETSDFAGHISALLTLVALFLFMLTMILKTSFVAWVVVVFMIHTVWFFLSKEFMEYQRRVNLFRVLVISGLLGVNALTSGMLFYHSSASFFRFLSLVVIVATALFTLIFFSIKKNQISVRELLEEKVWNTKTISTNTGDAKLGVDRESRKPVIIPYKDRFLHMLILGPTGSGKTSQVITPLVYSDIKNHDMGVICLEPKGDLAEKVYALSIIEGREAIYFNPALKSCPYFNPLMGDESDVIENMVTTFKMLDPDSSSFFQDNNENLIRRSIKVLKRLFGNDATLQQLDMFINNVKGQKNSTFLGGFGDSTITTFETMNKTEMNPRIQKENEIIVSWFRDEYFPGSSGVKNAPKVYEHCSGVRGQVSKLISNKYLSRVLNPPKTSELKEGEYLDFDAILRDGLVCAISSEQGRLRDLGRFLGFFLILQLQSSVFRRPGNEFTRRGCALYIDEFQVYANAGFSDMLTMGRSYRVASHLATQNRALIGMNSGKFAKGFLDLVSTNARNLVLFPGANAEDARYYSEQFGEDLVQKHKRSVSRDVSSLFKIRSFGGEKESLSVDEKYERRVRSTDITYRQFGEVIYSIIQHDNIQNPGVCKVQFIPTEVNEHAKEFLEKYNKEQAFGENELVKTEFITNEISLEHIEIEEDGFEAYEDIDPVDISVEAIDPFSDLLG